MSSIPEGWGPGGVTAARRIFLMRRLVAEAANQYEATMSFCGEIDRAIPEDYAGDLATVDSADPESGAWWVLLRGAEEAHHNAESVLAGLIHNLWAYFAPGGPDADSTAEGSSYQERAITIGGTTYVLADDPADFEPGRNFIAVIRPGRVVNLDG